jgi:hypothetical protein
MNSVANGENVPALEFAGLFKRFGDNVAVDHIDLAVPVGLAWAAFWCRRSVQLAQQRLENYGPEIFARVRAPAS